MKRSLLLAFITLSCLFLSACSTPTHGQARGANAIVFEGARVITGDGTAPIENSVIVVEETCSRESAAAATFRCLAVRNTWT